MAKYSKNEYLLSGKVSCGKCKSAYGAYMQPKWKQVGGQKTLMAKYSNYRCKNTKGRSFAPCHNRQLSGQVLETQVWAKVEELLENPQGFIESIQAMEDQRQDIKELEEKRAMNEKLLNELDSEYLRACELFEKGLKYQGKGEIEAKAEEIRKGKEKIQAELDSICSRLMNEEDKKDRIASAKDIAVRYSKALGKFDYQTKREIIQELVKRIEVYPETVRVEFAITRKKKDGEATVIHHRDPCGATGRA